LFAIDWLRRGIPVERETSVLANAEDAIAAARARADVVAKRHPGQEPDSFRLIDATGTIVGTCGGGQREFEIQPRDRR
jgi:hypothetical protein